MLRLLTAWEENMPIMEKATEKLYFSASELSVGRTTQDEESFIVFSSNKKHHICNLI